MFPVRFLTRASLVQAAQRLEVSVEVIRAVIAVEARKGGFITGTDLPCILFEGHKFSKFTGGVFDDEFPDISHPDWTKAHYLGGRGEYDRLLKAIRANGGDPDPALMATSWGMFQIMGFNFDRTGYASVREFVNDMSVGEDRHLDAFVSFIEAEGLADELRDQKWADFARAYNGAGYKQNKYDIRLAQEYTFAVRRAQEARAGGEVSLERDEAMKLQSALNIALHTTMTVDGWIGPNTRAAVRKLKKRDGLPNPDVIDRALCEHLGIDLPALAAQEA